MWKRILIIVGLIGAELGIGRVSGPALKSRVEIVSAPHRMNGNGVASARFLEHAVALVRKEGFAIVNVDSTVIIEKPKLKDYRLAIRESLARTLALPLDRVSVKFKTAEGVGPVGEGLSAEAQAIVTLSK